MIDLLRKLGLNKYESEAYIALARLGSAGAFQISKLSGVPFGRIYDSLNVLVMKGLVEMVPSKPKKYVAVNPRAALNGLVDERFNELSSLRSEIKTAVTSLSKEEQGDSVSVSTGKVNLAKRVMEHFTYNNEFWSLSEGFNLEKSYPAIKRYIKGKPSSRYVLVDKGKCDINRLKKLVTFGVNVRHYPVKDTSILVSDGELVTISFSGNNIHTRSKVLGKSLMKLLRSAWSKAQKI